jgi:alpha-amylase/alpha-mannosidase (GH57 family)
MKSALVIHGHFYQPPRENPWTQAVERESSAHPFHDWNQRIHEECYRANAFARIYDSFGRIERIQNNYELLSFNFGPTLLSWMEQHDPVAYARILEADRVSAARNDGHGNAIAQGFNHAILPLCSERDRRTQIRWGIRDFTRRFGRAPEALWLPETACNDATLGNLIDEGMRYAILSPYQAARVRRIGGDDWSDVGAGTIDPGHPYAYYHRDGSGRSIALFFYDGPISRAVAFEGTLASSQAFVGRLKQAGGGAGRLVHVATDGESYGHHTRHGERSLAHALAHEAGAQGFEITNYGAFLAKHPPSMEVEIKNGAGEGTAWSCAHGVGRWYRDCGCNTGARAEWNQAWRGPLRNALDLLRDEVANHFEETRGELFVDPWAARDDYVGIMNAATGVKDDWLQKHAGKRLRARERDRALSHLELQHNAQLMYTSCGWFFADVSGIETTQIMKYAQRALDLCDELDLPSPRDRFLSVLAEARSNLPQMGNGADVFRRFVDPLRLFPGRVAAHVAISSLVEDPGPSGVVSRYRFRCSSFKKQRHGRLIMATAHIELEDSVTERHHDFGLVAMHFGGVDFYCVARPYPGARQFNASAAKLWANFRTASLPVMLRIAQEELGPDEFGLESLLPEGRQRISELIFGDIVGNFAEQYARLYENNQRVLEMLQDAGLELPQELTVAAEFTFSRRFEAAMKRAAGTHDPKEYLPAIRIAEEAERRGYKIDHTTTAPLFAKVMVGAVARAIADLADDSIASACELAAMATKLGLTASLAHAQELYDDATRTTVPSGLLRRLGKELGLAGPKLALSDPPGPIGGTR